jgi:hypothetical protein
MGKKSLHQFQLVLRKEKEIKFSLSFEWIDGFTTTNVHSIANPVDLLKCLFDLSLESQNKHSQNVSAKIVVVTVDQLALKNVTL